MAYNSDGYIMFDFSDVDFRRATQTIDGLYERCVKIIGTNKFILVINANGKTPLPSVCSFVNNQYVIESCIYTFAITSADSLFIRRNDVPARDIIDDTIVSADKTWSSNKINIELDTKADTSALADYQPLLTPGTNITIDENNVISASGGVEIDDTVIVNNKVWSSLNTVEKLAPIDTIVNNPVTFNTSLALPLISCKVSFSAKQVGSGDPSPSNPRVINGVSDISLTVNSTPVSVSLDSTRYGGELDIVTGILTVTYTILNLGDYNYTHYPSLHVFRMITTSGVINSVISDIYKSIDYVDWDKMSNYSVEISSTDLIIKNEDYSDASTFKTAMEGHYVVFKRKTPLTIQLSPSEIFSIIGNNILSTDEDILTVSYRHLPGDLI